MIVAEVKPFKEIKEMVKDFKKVLVLGCGSCVTVCMSGGEKQVELLASALRLACKAEQNQIVVDEKTILRQCDPEFIEQIQDEAAQYDAIVSMACGAGVQGVTDKLKNKVVLPAMNTRFIGMTDSKGNWLEVCTACGDCVLAVTGGICPVTTCPKGILNGPCGGNKKGYCEVSPDVPCAWVRIYERLKELGRLDLLKREIAAKDWSKRQRPGKYSIEETETEKVS
jgi:ferredoxin